jgi:hypothetical protein
MLIVWVVDLLSSAVWCACRAEVLEAQQLAAPVQQQEDQAVCSTQQCWRLCCLGQVEQQVAPAALAALVVD